MKLYFWLVVLTTTKMFGTPSLAWLNISLSNRCYRRTCFGRHFDSKQVFNGGALIETLKILTLQFHFWFSTLFLWTKGQGHGSFGPIVNNLWKKWSKWTLILWYYWSKFAESRHAFTWICPVLASICLNCCRDKLKICGAGSTGLILLCVQEDLLSVKHALILQRAYIWQSTLACLLWGGSSRLQRASHEPPQWAACRLHTQHGLKLSHCW